MLRLLYALLLGLVGAGIVHVVILFLLPRVSEQDAWTRITAASEPYAVIRIDGGAGGGQALIGGLDPLFAAAACRFDLADGTMLATGSAEVPFWSASVFGRDGRLFYSLNDRSASGGGIDLAVLTSSQQAERLAEETEPSRTIPVQAEASEGFLVVRAFIPDASWRKRVDDFLAGLSCAVE